MNENESRRGLTQKPETPRRSTREVEQEVWNWIYRAGRPVRWKDLAKMASEKGMAGKVLSDALKRMIAKGHVDAGVKPDEKGRLRIHYILGVRFSEEFLFPKFEKKWHNIYEEARATLKKPRLSREKRIETLKRFFYRIIRTDIEIYLVALSAAINSKDDSLSEQNFNLVWSLLSCTLSIFLRQLFLENKDIAPEALDAVFGELKKQAQKKLA